MTLTVNSAHMLYKLGHPRNLSRENIITFASHYNFISKQNLIRIIR